MHIFHEFLVTVYWNFNPIRFCGENVIEVLMFKGDKVAYNTALSQD